MECENKVKYMENDKQNKDIRKFVESLDSWVWEIDELGRFAYASPNVEKILGYHPTEIIGRTLFEIKDEEGCIEVIEEVRRIMISQKPFQGLKMKNKHKRGHLIVVEASGEPIYDLDGKIIGWIGVERIIKD